MKRWEDVKRNIRSLSATEKEEIEFAAAIVSQLVNRRHELGLSQHDLAEASGLKQSAIARMETLGYLPQPDTLYKITKILGLKIAVG
ncbi:DNA-binding transcriptional repressor PuuR [Peptococcaceae bacterium CEB3]|nr:DNA-binding transcriptional repressor PuuR [Peptococcaceae bacterium CEB3]